MADTSWIVRGARVVVADDRFSYDGEHGVVLSAAGRGGLALVRLDGAEDVYCAVSTLRREGDS
jgi:hypothetical protein